MKIFNLNYNLIKLYIISIILLLSSIKSQEIEQTEEKQLFNNSLNHFNKTETPYLDISQKMKNVKFDILLKIRYKGIERSRNKIQIKIVKIRDKLDSNTYKKTEVLEEIKELDKKITNFEDNCYEAINEYYKNVEIYNIVKNMIIVFFKALLIIIIIIMIIIGIVSIYIIRKQRQYAALEDESSKENIMTEENSNSNSAFNQVIIKNENSNDSSSSRDMKEKAPKKNENNDETNEE